MWPSAIDSPSVRRMTLLTIIIGCGGALTRPLGPSRAPHRPRAEPDIHHLGQCRPRVTRSWHRTLTGMPTPTLRRLGRSGLAVWATVLECNNLGRTGTVTADLGAARAVVDAAIDAGITLFDVADIYGAQPGLSEEFLGRILGGRRDQIVLATKFGMDAKGATGRDDGPRGSRRYLRQAVEASLRRLQTDWIDLYQLHAPDPSNPLDETPGALHDLGQQGKG